MDKLQKQIFSLGPSTVVLLIALLVFVVLVVITAILPIAGYRPNTTESLASQETVVLPNQPLHLTIHHPYEEDYSVIVKFTSVSNADKVRCPTVEGDCFPKPDHKFVIVSYQNKNTGRYEESIRMKAELYVTEDSIYRSWYGEKGLSNEVRVRPSKISLSHDVFSIPQNETPLFLTGKFTGPRLQETRFKLKIP